MIEMTFDKQEVIATLRKNLGEHHLIFTEAVEGYRKEAMRVLDRQIIELQRSDGPVKVMVHMKAPENHERDYVAVLSMLETSTDSHLVFNDEQYRHYMLDEWDWQRGFLASNSAYSATATGKMDREGPFGR